MSGLWGGILTATLILVPVVILVTVVTITQVRRGEHHQ